jgi:hypothetical protein
VLFETAFITAIKWLALTTLLVVPLQLEIKIISSDFIGRRREFTARLRRANILGQLRSFKCVRCNDSGRVRLPENYDYLNPS